MGSPGGGSVNLAGNAGLAPSSLFLTRVHPIFLFWMCQISWSFLLLKEAVHHALSIFRMPIRQYYFLALWVLGTQDLLQTQRHQHLLKDAPSAGGLSFSATWFLQTSVIALPAVVLPTAEVAGSVISLLQLLAL